MDDRMKLRLLFAEASGGASTYINLYEMAAVISDLQKKWRIIVEPPAKVASQNLWKN